MDNFICPFWCFVFLLHCLIYKVHATSQRVSYILAQLSVFVKRFFKLFSSFFNRLFKSLPRLATALIEYHPSKEMSSTFFIFFQFF